MKNIFQRKNVNIILFLFMSLELLCLFVFNLTHTKQFLDSDSASAVRHAIEMWKNHTLFIENWCYVSTLEIDAATFFAVPLCYITHSLPVSISLAHAFFACILCLIIVDIYRNLDYPEWQAYLAIMLVFAPYYIYACNNNLSYNHMLFVSGGQYEFRIITLLFLIDILICKKRKKQIFLIIPYLCFLFWTSLSSGNFVLVMGICPIVLVVLLERINQQRFTIKNFENMILLLSVIISFAGIFIKSHASVECLSARNNMTLANAETFAGNLINCFVGVFLLTGSVQRSGDVPNALSVEGIFALTKMLLVLSCIILPVYVAKKQKALQRNRVLRFALGIAFVDYFILLVTNSQYGSSIFEERYHLLWFVVVLVCLPMVLEIFLKNQNNECLRRVAWCGIITGVLFINVFGYIQCYTQENPIYNAASVIMEATKDVPADNILVYNMGTETNIMRALDTDNSYISFTYQDGSLEVNTLDYYSDVAQYFKPQYYYNLLVVKKEDYAQLPETVRKFYTLYREQDVMGDEQETIQIYVPDQKGN